MWSEVQISSVEILSRSSDQENRRQRRFLSKMGNNESQRRSKSDNHAQSSSEPFHQTSESSAEDHPSTSSNVTTPSKSHPTHAQRSFSVPSARYRLDSSGSHYSYSAYSSSMEGGYADHGDGMQPMTFGGNYHKAVPRVKSSQNFEEAHGYKLTIPIDSKQGSGFDLDWQYNAKKVRGVIAQRSLNPDHPLYHKLTPKIVEEGPTPSTSTRRNQ